MSPYLCDVRVRQSVSVAVRAEVDEGDGESEQTEDKCHHWRILGYIISKVSHWLPETHHHTPGIQRTVNQRFSPSVIYSTTVPFSSAGGSAFGPW